MCLRHHQLLFAVRMSKDGFSEFVKGCMEQKKAGSLYICGCPGTGKSPSMEKVRQQAEDWAKQTGLPCPETVSVNCTSLKKTTAIFSKILGKNDMGKKTNGPSSPLQRLQILFSHKQQSSSSKMMSALEILEIEVRGSIDHGPQGPVPEYQVVKMDHMIAALFKSFKSPVVDTIQSLPQHQQIIVCYAAKAFRGSQKDRTIAELNKLYLEICKSSMITRAEIT